MKLDNLRDLTLCEIADLMAAETQSAGAFDGLVFATEDPETAAIAARVAESSDVRRVRLHAVRDRMGDPLPDPSSDAVGILVGQVHRRTTLATAEVVREAIRVAGAAEWTALLAVRYRTAMCHLRQLGLVEESHLFRESAAELTAILERLLALDNQTAQTALLAEARTTGVPSDVPR